MEKATGNGHPSIPISPTAADDPVMASCAYNVPWQGLVAKLARELKALVYVTLLGCINLCFVSSAVVGHMHLRQILFFALPSIIKLEVCS